MVVAWAGTAVAPSASPNNARIRTLLDFLVQLRTRPPNQNSKLLLMFSRSGARVNGQISEIGTLGESTCVIVSCRLSLESVLWKSSWRAPECKETVCRAGRQEWFRRVVDADDGSVSLR